MTAIRAVRFDADGVMINPQLQFSRLLAAEYQLTPTITAPFFQGVFNDCLNGRTRLEDALPPYLDQWQWQGTVEDFIALWLETDDQVDGRMAAEVRKLRAKGLICGLATLQERRRAAYMRTVMGFGDLFDRLYFSCEIGDPKPQPEFYQWIEQDLRLAGQAILFWDDAPKNVIAARAAGWNAEVYENYDQYQAVMARLDG